MKNIDRKVAKEKFEEWKNFLKGIVIVAILFLVFFGMTKLATIGSTARSFFLIVISVASIIGLYRDLPRSFKDWAWWKFGIKKSNTHTIKLGDQDPPEIHLD